MDRIKWHLDRIKEAVEGKENAHQMLGRIQHNIGELMKYYEDGTLVHKKNRKKGKIAQR